MFDEQEPGVTYEWLISKINSRILERTEDQKTKLCFQLYDINNDGKICASDLFHNN